MQPRPYQVRAKTACEAVGLDRDRFNEDAAAGLYPCAPETSSGRPRIFEEPDLIALYFFAFLRRLGVSPERSGGTACIVRNKAQQLVNSGREIAGDVVLGWDHAGSVAIAFGEDVKATLDGSQNAFSGTYSPMVFSMRFALANVLTIVKDRVEELRAPIGED